MTGKTATKSESMIDGLRELILRMGALAEAILAKALRCVAERDRELGAAVQRDDLEIDRLDVAIDDAILRALALQA
ncbi:MAG: PhoU domain-containing protein, partial [bacterium]